MLLVRVAFLAIVVSIRSIMVDGRQPNKFKRYTNNFFESPFAFAHLSFEMRKMAALSLKKS